MKKKITVFTSLMAIAFVLSGFQFVDFWGGFKDPIRIVLPANFPKPLYDVKITDDGFILGKTLFYDAIISADGSVSCGNCHQASAAFANLNTALSRGINNCNGTRSAPPLFNLIWQKDYMWDGRLSKMAFVPIDAITNPCEMGTDIKTVVTKLKGSPNYQQLFTKAFGSAEITEAKTLEALSQFTAMLISADSKYDKVMRKEANYSFTENEKIGYAIFKQRCNSCHTEPLFTDQSYRNNGLAIKPKDLDRYHFTHNNSDIGKFRVPTLRNIEITGPYMHDGRIYSLKEVLQHYVAGLEINGNLDQLLKADGQIGIPLTATEQLRLIDFLKTLTDVNFINDRRFNNH